jgi:hypothetical protein
MLADMGIKWVVLGHSERRENCGETSQIVAGRRLRGRFFFFPDFFLSVFSGWLMDVDGWLMDG